MYLIVRQVSSGWSRKTLVPADAPDGVIEREQARRNNLRATRGLEVLDHLFRAVPVLANDEVNMVWHDRTRVARVLARGDRVREACCDEGELLRSELAQRMLQQLARLLVEPANVARRGLNLLATVVKIPELSQDRVLDLVGVAPARVVREPPPVDGPDEVVRDDERIGHRNPNKMRGKLLSRKRQFRSRLSDQWYSLTSPQPSPSRSAPRRTPAGPSRDPSARWQQRSAETRGTRRSACSPSDRGSCGSSC
jgi:hypothetical protein